MSVPTIQHSQIYDGNGSTVTAYAIPFPFLAIAEMKVAVKPPGGEFAVLADGQYTVSRLPDGSGGSVTTATAYANTYRVQVFRATSLLQPVDLPDSGALPSAAVEGGLDRLTMALQELNARVNTLLGIPNEGVVSVPGGSVALAQDVATWTDAAARSAVVPKRVGQLGVQTADDSIWIAQSTAAGDWQEFAPTATPPAMANKLVFLATGDAGTPGTAQSEIITRAYEWAVTGIICAGDNHYSPATFSQAWAAFDPFIADGKVDRALGNHDKDDWTLDAAKFSYLPNTNGHRRYYKRSFGNGLLDIFVLHSGRDSSWNAIEPDGNYPGSAQHAWFVSQLAASKARWKIAVFHHPPVTSSVENLRADINLDWPEFSQLDGVLCAHVHFSEWLTCRGTPVVNISGGVQRDGDVSDLLNLVGADAIGSNLLWHDDRRQLVAKLTVTPTCFLVAYHKLVGGELVYQRDLADKTPHRSEWGREVVGPGTVVPDASIVIVGICPVPLCRGAWVIGVAIPGNSTLAGNVLVDGAVAGSWSLAAGEFWVEIDSLRNVRRGARVQVQITTNAAYGGWYGLEVTYKGQMAG